MGTIFRGKHSQWVRLQLKRHETPIFICECYFPHSKALEEHKIVWSEITQQVSKLSLEGHIIIMGDFNSHIGANGDQTKVDATGKLLLEKLQMLQLNLLNTDPICEGSITRSVFHSTDLTSHNSTIDYMAISESLRPYVSEFKIHTDALGSDHFPLTLTLRGLKSLKLTRAVSHETWDIGNIPVCPDPDYAEPFHNAFATWIDQQSALIREYEESNKDMQALADIFDWSFQKCLEDIALEKIGKKRIRPRANPNMSKALRLLNQTRQKVAEETRLIMHDHKSSPDLKSKAIAANKKAKSNLKRAQTKLKKAQELAKFAKITNSQTSVKVFWSHMKRHRTTFKNAKSPPPMIDRADGTVASDHMEILKIWKDFTQTQDRETVNDTKSFDNKFFKDMHIQLRLRQIIRQRQQTLDDSISREEVWKAIRHLKMGKAAGVDGMTSDIIRAAAGAIGSSTLTPENHTVDAITLLFNFVYDKEVWPTRWSQGIIIPLHKQDSPTNPANYRPITLLPIMQKLFGYILNQRLISWTEGSDSIHDAQGGFRWNRSTIDQILLKREILRIRKELGLDTFVTYIDIRKAYDKVWREANFVRMYDMGIQGKAWRQLQLMNNSLRCKIRLPLGDTDWIDLKSGLAQGAVESPWMFNCFINGVAEELTKHGFGIMVNGVKVALLMYADDIVLFANSATELEDMNRVVSQYAYKHRFKFNGSKSAVMVFTSKSATRALVNKKTWSLFGERVEVKSQYKYLGVTIDAINPWNWRKHFKEVLQKARLVNRQLLYSCKYDDGLLPRPARTFWKAKVRPILEYAAEIWYGEIPADLMAQAERIQTDFARGILGLHHADGISNKAILAELGLEPLQARWAKLRAGYWRRIFTYKNSRLLKQLIVARYQQTKENPELPGWCQKTKEILEIHNLHGAWLHPEQCASVDKEAWKSRVYNAVDSHYDNIRSIDMSALRSTTRYRQIKNWNATPRDRCFSMGEQEKLGMLRVEPYLDDITDPIGRKLKTLARLGSLPLMDKIGSQQNWLTNRKSGKWLCPLCGKHNENLQHYLLDCEALDHLRSKLMSKIDFSLIQAQSPHTHRLVRRKDSILALPETRQCPSIIPENRPLTAEAFHLMPPEEKMLVILGKHIGCQTAERHIDTHVKRFLRKSWRLRRPHVVATNKKYKRHDYLVAF